MEPFERTAHESFLAIQRDELTPEALVRSCLERIAAVDTEIRAWLHVDPANAINLARAQRITNRPGSLFGIPYGVKDVIDTAKLPTTYNSPLYKDYQPAKDAACVTLLNGQGGILLGKTDTVEFASVGRVARSQNPHRPGHTPGGSSSGSAAAVAAGMAPIALGTQTGGSTIRPAAYCGIFGMKPTYGRVSTEGMREYATSLDTIGWMGRAVEDLAMVAKAFGLTDRISADDHPIRPRIGLLRTPYWDDANDEVKRNLDEACHRLSARRIVVSEIDEGKILSDLNEYQDIIMHGEGRAAYLPEYREHREQLHAGLVDEVENSKGITPADMRRAYDRIGQARPKFEALFSEVDICLTAAVPGEAPEGLTDTGLATFNRLFTALHVPCITVPFGTGRTGLPLGIQLVGKRFDDQRLLALAQYISSLLDVKWRLPQ